ncbi:MAG: hypothetical protein NTW21_15695 [Verrucomicrobia bacterium]|nr:hypothetical protein [Verrucomicrobiota bacterium]
MPVSTCPLAASPPATPSNEKITWPPATRIVIYRSKSHRQPAEIPLDDERTLVLQATCNPAAQPRRTPRRQEDSGDLQLFLAKAIRWAILAFERISREITYNARLLP